MMMNRALGLVTLAFASVSAAAAEPGPPGSQEARSADHRQLEALNAVWLKSYETRDREALGSVLADDFIGVYGNSALSRLQMLDRLSAWPPMRVSWGDLHIHINGDTAVVAARSTITTGNEAARLKVRYDYADVYARQEGEWRAIAAHAVRLPD